MFVLIRHFYQLLILQRAPQDFPASPFLLVLVGALHFAIGFFGHLTYSDAMLYALGRALLDTGLTLAGAWVLLAIFGRASRWLQTAIVLTGGEAMIALMSLPFIFVMSRGITNILLELSLLLFFIWNIVFVGHVWRHALETNMLVGVVLATGLIVMYLSIASSILPFSGAS